MSGSAVTTIPAHGLYTGGGVAAYQVYYDSTASGGGVQLMDFLLPNGTAHSILIRDDRTWSLDRGRKRCCLDPNQSGVGPPRPDWLRNNGTKDMGVHDLNGAACRGWQRSVPDSSDIIEFSWWLREANRSQPCMLGWQTFTSMYVDFWDANPTFAGVNLTVPEYCPMTNQDPSCSIFRCPVFHCPPPYVPH